MYTGKKWEPNVHNWRCTEKRLQILNAIQGLVGWTILRPNRLIILCYIKWLLCCFVVLVVYCTGWIYLKWHIYAIGNIWINNQQWDVYLNPLLHEYIVIVIIALSISRLSFFTTTSTASSVMWNEARKILYSLLRKIFDFHHRIHHQQCNSTKEVLRIKFAESVSFRSSQLTN